MNSLVQLVQLSGTPSWIPEGCVNQWLTVGFSASPCPGTAASAPQCRHSKAWRDSWTATCCQCTSVEKKEKSLPKPKLLLLIPMWCVCRAAGRFFSVLKMLTSSKRMLSVCLRTLKPIRFILDVMKPGSSCCKRADWHWECPCWLKWVTTVWPCWRD